jgi:hypothetical protein
MHAYRPASTGSVRWRTGSKGSHHSMEVWRQRRGAPPGVHAYACSPSHELMVREPTDHRGHDVIYSCAHVPRCIDSPVVLAKTNKIPGVTHADLKGLFFPHPHYLCLACCLLGSVHNDCICWFLCTIFEQSNFLL